jgi:hypothetical protein
VLLFFVRIDRSNRQPFEGASRISARRFSPQLLHSRTTGRKSTANPTSICDHLLGANRKKDRPILHHPVRWVRGGTARCSRIKNDLFFRDLESLSRLSKDEGDENQTYAWVIARPRSIQERSRTENCFRKMKLSKSIVVYIETIK